MLRTLEWIEIGGSEQSSLPVFYLKHSHAFTEEEAILNRYCNNNNCILLFLSNVLDF